MVVQDYITNYTSTSHQSKVFWSLKRPSGGSISEHGHGPKSCSTELVNRSEKQTASLRSVCYSTGHSGSEPTMIPRSFSASTNETWKAGKALTVAVKCWDVTAPIVADRRGPRLGSFSVPWSILETDSSLEEGTVCSEPVLGLERSCEWEARLMPIQQGGSVCCMTRPVWPRLEPRLQQCVWL